MDNFLLQSIDGKLDTEVSEARDLLEQLGLHYIIREESINSDVYRIEDYIPIGSIPFVEDHLRTYHKVPYSCPIEVPKFLRTPDILQRKYDIVKVKNLPKDGAYFIKSAQHLKTVQYCGLVDHAHKLMEPGDWCVISEVISPELIEGEYRVFVHKGKVQAIKNYTLTSYQPKEEDVMHIVKLMNENFFIDTYSFDIGIINEHPTDKPKIFIIEVHLVSSLGTYGFNDPILIEMYSDTYKFFKSKKHIELINNRNLIW